MLNFKLFFLVGVLVSKKLPATAGSQHHWEQSLAVQGQKGFNTFVSSVSFYAFHELGFLTYSQVFLSDNCLLAGNAAKCQHLSEQDTLQGHDPHCWCTGCWDSGVGAGQEDSCDSPPLDRSWAVILWYCGFAVTGLKGKCPEANQCFNHIDEN